MKKIGLTKRVYSEEFKHAIQKKILLEGLTGPEVIRLYGINRSTVYRWIEDLNSKKSDLCLMSKESTSSKDLEKKRIEELERALEISELRAKAYKALIKKAEEKFKIVIEKKSGPK